jgi:enoyl-CoA hydratase
MPERVSVEDRGHLRLIGLNRPEKMNAADEQMLSELSLAYGEANEDDNVRVVVVHAHGDHFTAGLDLNDVGPKMATGKLTLVPEGGLDPWGISTEQISKPVVMAIRGNCFTLGTELALASEVVVASTDAVFGQLEVSRGILPFGGGTIRMPRVAGWSNAMRYLLTGELFSAEVAKSMNIVTEIADDPMAKALEIAEKISAQAPLAVQQTLESSRNSLEGDEERMLMRRLENLMMTQDVQRGMEAFISKQPAKFEGN